MNRTLKLIILTIFLSFCTSAVFAEGQPEYKKVSNLSVGQGLSHYTTNCFYTDRFGILWIGTSYGLNKVVGNNVVNFTKDYYPGLCDNSINDICGDNLSNIFILGSQGVSVFDEKTETFSLITADRQEAFAYTDGILYLSDGSGISEYPVEEGFRPRPFPVDSLSLGGRIRKIEVGSDSSLFVATETRFLKMSLRGEIAASVEISYPNDIMIDSRGSAWVSMKEGGILRMSPDLDVTFFSQDVADPTSNWNNVRAVVQTSPYIYYVGSFGGLSVLDARTGEFRETLIYRKYHNDCSQSIRGLHYDGKGNLWIGSFYGGAFRHDLEGEDYDIRYFFDDSNEVPNRHILSVSREASGDLWFCTSTSGLYRFDAATSTTYRFPSFPNSYTKSTFLDSRRGILWVGTVDEGVYELNVRTGSVVHCPRYTSDGSRQKVFNVLKIVGFDENRLLLATSNGVMVLDKGSRTIRSLQGTLKKQVLDICLNGKNLWTATNAGTVRYDLEDGSVRTYDTDIFQCFHNDRYGRTWFGSRGGGLYLYDEGSDCFMSFAEGLPDNARFITAISDSPDPEKMMVGTNRGLFSFDLADETFSKVLDGIIINEEGLLYSKDAGCNYVCSMNDAFSLGKGDRKAPMHSEAIYLTDLYADGERVRPCDESGILETSTLFAACLDLETGAGDVSLRFTGPGNLCYSLSPVDKEYRTMDVSGLVPLDRLKTGRYTLSVKEMTTGENAQSFSIPIKVTPPFYRNPFLIVILAILLVAGTVSAVHAYCRKMSASLPIDGTEGDGAVPVSDSSDVESADAPATTPDSIKLLKTAENIVDANIGNPSFSIPEFAQMMGLSRTYLFTKIKSMTGLTPNEFIINRKLRQASAAILSHPDKRISDIAYEYGFSAPSYFSKCFKDLFGVTPAEYRRNSGNVR